MKLMVGSDQLIANVITQNQVVLAAHRPCWSDAR